MKQVFVVFVYICYICVNEKYLFTKADYNLKGTTIPFNHEGIQIPCNHSLIIDIHNVTVPMDIQSCKEHQCLINTKDMIDIAQRCNGANICKPNVNLTTECLREQTIARYQISYGCEVMCSFESDQCQYVDAVDDGDMLNWTRTKVNAISGISVNYPSGSGMICYKQENGSIMYFESNKAGVKARMKIPTTKREGWICVNFWYIANGAKTNPLILYQKYNDTIKEYNAQEKNKWINVVKEVYIDNSTYIIFEANFRNGNGALGLDDISISMNKCTDPKITYSQCGYWNADLNMTNCPTFFISRLQILFTNNDISPEKQNCTDVKQIASDVKTNCLHNYRLDYCVINLSRIVYSSNHTCLVPHKSIYIEYFCKENTTHTDDTTKASTWSASAKSQRTYPISETTTSVAILTQTVSSTPQRDVITDSLESDSPSSTPVTGIVVGVVLFFVALSVVLVIAFIYFRRTRYAEKKGHSIVANEDSQSDYTGHQNTAFSPDVDVTTQIDYCEIRTSKHNDQYHDITDTFSPSINTTNDDEYSEIANVVNPPNSNPNLSTNYQHQYISLDPNATGFDRSNQKTNLQNESKNNHNSDEKTSFMGGDDYAILDPDHLNESKNTTPKVLPLSENYVVLDPSETGFNRQENTDTVCNYELATPINPTMTSEDPYDVSKDETYDTSSNSRHKEKENNIYSHMVDNVYDTAGNQRKKEDNDGTYDHFYGQQSEDDYDISKPL